MQRTVIPGRDASQIRDRTKGNAVIAGLDPAIHPL
jgi:hypothetical protein